MVNEKQKIEKAIHEALVFFDLFDYPLTAVEARKYCFLKCGFDEVENELALMNSKGFVDRKDGFYFLPGRDAVIEGRQRRILFSERKFRKANRIVKIFKIIPWIKMIAIGNIIGENNLKDESDIDFFIVTNRNRIWLSRLIANGITKVLGLRPEKDDMRDKICLSFFITELEMNLEKLMLGASDIYFVYWLAGLKVIYDKEETWEKFKNQNTWIYKHLPNLRIEKNTPREYTFAWYLLKFKKAFGLSLDRLEFASGKFQRKILPKILKEKMNKGTEVVINDNILKLHTNDRRLEYLERFRKKISEKIK